MVDLGWPWWVSTVIAVSVVAVSIVVFAVARHPFVRGVAATLAAQGVVMAVAAPFLMPGSSDGDPRMAGRDTGGAAMSADSMSGGMEGLGATGDDRRLPYTFFLTRYEFLGNADDPNGVRYHSDGTPVATAPNGSTMLLSGAGAWDPVSGRATGGGFYTIEGRGRAVVASGTWQVRRFVTFRQVPGWWPPGFREQGWQGPPGSQSFSGMLDLEVALERRGSGVLRVWCVMSERAKKTLARGWDGITLVGPRLAFTNFEANEGRAEGGVMFYGPGRKGSR